MLAVFLPGLNFRGNRSPYLWWFYKSLTELGENACYLGGREYFAGTAAHLDRGRSEVDPGVARAHAYSIPDDTTLARILRSEIEDGVWQAIEARHADPLAALRHFCLQDDVDLRNALASSLDDLTRRGGEIEAVISFVNCAALQQLCRERALPLIHVELGPLRPPSYLPTAYFDTRGVNGNTEAAARFRDAGITQWTEPTPDTAALRALFMIQAPDTRGPITADLGIGLQVEDDSNVVCYANGYSSLSLVNDAIGQLYRGELRAPVLIRTHPASIFTIQRAPSGFAIDRSPTSIDFLLKCRRLTAINSSVAVEAMLLERAVDVRGDCAVAHCVGPDGRPLPHGQFAFFLLNYLAPWRLALSAEYIRWRLTRPGEDAIRRRHLETLMQSKIDALQDKVTELQARIAELEETLRRLHSSYSWRITQPLRALRRAALRLVAPEAP